MRIQRFVLDTSVFTTYEGNKKSIEKHILELIDLIVEGRTKGISCYFPPSTWKELVGILEKKGIPKEKIEKLDAWTIEKNPSVLELTIPAKFLEDYLLENFERINKGLRETEKIISLAKEKPEEECIKLLRKKYREAVRKGIIDSKEDLDALFLAKELNAGLVTEDEGLIKWAKKWGIRYEDGKSFRKLLEEVAMS